MLTREEVIECVYSIADKDKIDPLLNGVLTLEAQGEIEQLRTANAEQAERIKQLERALDDQMVITHLGVFGPKDDPIMAIHKLMCWSQDVGAFFAKDRIAQLEDALRAAKANLYSMVDPALVEKINEVLKENSNEAAS